MGARSITIEPRLLQSIGAFARLTEPRLELTVNSSRTYPLSGLQILLDRARNLEILELGLGIPSVVGGHKLWITDQSIFPKSGGWPHLR